MIEIEVQNETHQSVHRIKAMAVPRIGEGIRLLEPSGQWASYDIIDVWYQQAEFGEVCAFLCAASAGYITGQNLLIDGGRFPGAF